MSFAQILLILSVITIKALLVIDIRRKYGWLRLWFLRKKVIFLRLLIPYLRKKQVRHLGIKKC